MMNINMEEEVPKKRGRKPKNKDDIEKSPREKKKRGRKPKVDKLIVDTGEVRVRKRGRKPKYKIESISEIRAKYEDTDKVEFSNTKDVKAVEESDYNKTQVSFGNLNITVTEKPEIDKDELRNMFKIEETVSNTVITSPIVSTKSKTIYVSPPPSSGLYSESESEFESMQVKQCCNCESKKNDDNLVIVKKREIHYLLYKFNKKLQEFKQWPSSTDILCWWCCHSFNDTPIPSVSCFDYKRDYYNLKGIFCSWECSLAYTLENNKSSINLYKLYRNVTGDLNFNVSAAPSRYVLKAFGGYMDIEEYRNSPHTKREIKIADDNRMSYINQEILEVYEELEIKKKKKQQSRRR